MQKKQYWYMTWMLAKTDVLLRYSGSSLGLLWVVLKPLSLFAVLALVFGSIFQSEPGYLQHLFLGLILWWYWFEGSMSAQMSLLSKGYMLKKLPVPHARIVLASQCHAAALFVVELLLFVGFLAISGAELHPVGLLLGALGGGVVVTLWNLAVGFLLAPITVRVRDVPQLWEVLLTVGFYAVPILYPLSVLPGHIAEVLGATPFAQMLQQVGGLMIEGNIGGLASLGWLFLASLLLAILCYLLFIPLTRKVNEYL